MNLVFYKIFDRIKVEHFNNLDSYETLFINVGEKNELIYYYPMPYLKLFLTHF